MSHLRYHKFRHRFLRQYGPISGCGLEIHPLTHFPLHFPLFQPIRQSLLINMKKSGESFFKKREELITKTFLKGDDKFDFIVINL